MPRYFPNKTESELKAYLNDYKGELQILRYIREELIERQTSAARELLKEVDAAIMNLDPRCGSAGMPDAGFAPLSPDSPQARAAGPKIAELRQQLLDLSSRNRLVNFKHSASSGRYVRVVDESAPRLFQQLQNDAKIELVPIPDPPDEPDDEDTEEFRTAFEQALLTDKSYLKAAKQIAELGGDEAESRLRAAQRALRDRIRRRLGLPPRSQKTLSLRDYALRIGIRPDYDLLDKHPQSGRARRENHWQTLMGYEELNRRLRGLEQSAREAQQEFGIETLYFIFGFLEWYPPTPDGESEELHLSPIVLQLASIQKKKSVGPRTVAGRRLIEEQSGGVTDSFRETFQLSAADAEEPAVNLTLKERLKADYHLVLPDFDPDQPDLTSYFEEVTRAISPYPGWRVRRFVTLTHLSFSRLPMWHDLAPDTPGQTPPHLHPLLGELFGGSSTSESSGDGSATRHVASDVPALVLDADSTQHAAIAAALTGRNLVIQGPPGTGKSQTIANLIAAAMWQGKTVLFVAEKLVALQAVYKRLAEQAGLGDFILELHSAKAGKKPVVESIRKRLDRGRVPRAADDLEIRRLHSESVQVLNSYAEAVNAPFGKLGWTVHDIVWRYLQAHECTLPQKLQTFDFPDAEAWTTHDWSARRTAVLEWAELATAIAREPKDKNGRHVWSWVFSEDAHVAEQTKIISHSRQLLSAANDLHTFLDDTGIANTNATLAELIKLELQMRQLGERPINVRPGMWQLAANSQGRASVQRIVDAYRQSETAAEKIKASAAGLLQDPNGDTEIARLSKLLQSLSPWYEADTAESLRDRHSATLTLKAEASCAAEVVSGLAGLLEVEAEWDTGSTTLHSLANLIELAAATPVPALGRSIDFESSKTTNIIAKAIADTDSLHQLRADLSELTDYEVETLSSGEIDPSIRVLTDSWFGSWLFNSGYRKAYRLAEMIGPHRSVHDRIELLSKISEFLQKRSALKCHPAAEASDGLFDGPDSNLDDLRSLIHWMEKVRGGTPMLPPINVKVRSLLHRVRRDVYDLSIHLAAADWPRKLRDLAKVCNAANCNLSAIPQLLCQEQASIEEALALIQKWGWSISLGQNSRQMITEALSEIALSKTVLADHANTATLFLPDVTTACREFDLVEDALRRISLTGLPPVWQQRLAAEGGITDWDSIAHHASSLREYSQRIQSELACLASLAGFVPRIELDWSQAPLNDVRATLSAALGCESALATRCSFLANQVVLRNRDLNGFAAAIGELAAQPSQAGELLDRVFIRTLCHSAFSKSAALRPFRHASPTVIRQKFRDYDETLKKLDQAALENRLLERRPPVGNSLGRVSERTELALLQHVCGLEAPRTPVRDLLRRSGKALQALKPCFMMSPLSVAQLVERHRLSFDMVIFDEASQIRPEDALSALARARQCVIVGDSHQLPPTAFAVKTVEAQQSDDEAEVDETPVVESILELAAAAYGSGPTLLWHYRSRDPALISYSNKEFYNGELRLFPAPYRKNPSSGVHYVDANGTYSARTNLIEAQRCAKAAIDFMRDFPKRSLGIVALNRPQADLIEFELTHLIAQTPHAAGYVAQWEKTIEPLFVKNLESVQGDERDVIFVSTVFGKDEDGNFFQRFGPINSHAGHRRLNVLFTRAKHQVVVFSSIPIEKIAVTETSHWGVRVLKQYLDFARSGRLESGLISGRSTDSPFEDAVKNALNREGFQCEPQVGVAGFFIDLGVRHPSHPDNFVLGIECDGAAYHSTRAARDRDRLRQEILENLGWSIYRVWSTDWFANPRAELQKLVSAIKEQIQNGRTGAPPPVMSFLRPKIHSDSENPKR